MRAMQCTNIHNVPCADEPIQRADTLSGPCQSETDTFVSCERFGIGRIVCNTNDALEWLTHFDRCAHMCADVWMRLEHKCVYF